MKKKLTDKEQWLIRAVLIILLIGANIYWLLPSEKDDHLDFRFWLVLLGVGCGYLVYCILKVHLINTDEEDNTNKRKQVFAIIAGCLVSIPLIILSLTPIGSLFGWIAIAVVIDIAALYFILTYDFNKL